MRFYRDIIADVDKLLKTSENHYHEWSPESIKLYWNICTNNPLIRRQFYPIEYWEDLLAWAAQKITTRPLTIVDVGCGNGNLIECISKIYGDVSIYGVDLSDESLEPAEERFKEHESIQFKVGSFDRLPFDDGSIDMVTCTEVLEHTFPTTFNKSFSEVSRVLKNGGYYLASVPFDEEAIFVCCPGCGSVFTPYQHMMFEIGHDDISRLLSGKGLELIDFYQSIDRSQPINRIKRLLKPIIINWLPGIAKRIFPKAGVSGFLARATTNL
jgi:ubiquinone/menaquinone biosynthesis C-methylase UbiE